MLILLQNMRKILKISFFTIVGIFAAIGFFLTAGYIAIQTGLTNTAGMVDLQRNSFLSQSSSTFSLANTEEWGVFKEAVVKDKNIIDLAATNANISPRLIVANLAVEQMRLYFSNREIYKEIFAPLNILGVQSQYSWGVMGIKQDTAIEVENNLKDPSSVFYPGPQYAHLLDFTSTSTDQERFNRLTDQHNRYYSYVYAALYMREIMDQWQRAGFNISNNVGVLSTLYNIGFAHSIPNANPQIGGAEIDINNTVYSFGGLAQEFYNSNELTDIFPK